MRFILIFPETTVEKLNMLGPFCFIANCHDFQINRKILKFHIEFISNPTEFSCN